MSAFAPHPSVHDLNDGAGLTLRLAHVYQPDVSPWKTPAYRFDICLEGHRAGTISLRVGGIDDLLFYAGHVGFLVDPPFRGRGLARRATISLFPLAQAHGINPIWIGCNPDNAASRATIEALGAAYVDTVDLPPDYVRYYARGERQKRRYTLALPIAASTLRSIP